MNIHSVTSFGLRNRNSAENRTAPSWKQQHIHCTCEFWEVVEGMVWRTSRLQVPWFTSHLCQWGATWAGPVASLWVSASVSVHDVKMLNQPHRLSGRSQEVSVPEPLERTHSNKLSLLKILKPRWTLLSRGTSRWRRCPLGCLASPIFLSHTW